jgi:hypothetical protein
MKKVMLTALFLLAVVSPLYASTDGRTDKGPMGRVGVVMGRGLLNLAGLPMEFFFTPAEEIKNHPKAWPLTFIPKTVTHIIFRAASAGGDIVFFPWIVPFTDDLSPLTEPMGLSEYPWSQK